MTQASPTPAAGLARFNALPEADATAALHTCCGSNRWAESMTARRPFASAADLFAAAETAWFDLKPADWLEAFSHHPRIGERNLAQARFAATVAQTGREQSGMAAASDAVRAEFAALNAQYEERFGHVFLICATGKTAEHMLGQIKQRLLNTPETELHNAAKEQNMITRIRLERMLLA